MENMRKLSLILGAPTRGNLPDNQSVGQSLIKNNNNNNNYFYLIFIKRFEKYIPTKANKKYQNGQSYFEFFL